MGSSFGFGLWIMVTMQIKNFKLNLVLESVLGSP